MKLQVAVILVTCLIALSCSDWLQYKKDSHRSNFEPVASRQQSWNFTIDRVFAVRELIIQGDNLVVSGTGWGFCYAPNYFVVNKNTGVQATQPLIFQCGQTGVNVITSGSNLVSGINSGETDSFLVNQDGQLTSFNESEYIQQITFLNEDKVLLTLRSGEWDNTNNEMKVVSLSEGRTVWTKENLTSGFSVVANSGLVYSVSSDLKSIYSIDSRSGQVISKINFYAPIPYRREGSYLLASNAGPEQIYLVNTDNDIHIRAYAEGVDGYVWESKPFGSFSPSLVALDNTGKTLFVVDPRFREVSFLDAKDGVSNIVLSHTSYSSIVGVTDDNQVAFAGESSVDFFTVDGKLANSVQIPVNSFQTRSCVLDKTAVYCCTASHQQTLECRKFLY